MANETQRELRSTVGDWSKTEPISDYATPLFVAKYLSPAVAIDTSERVRTWSDPAFATRVLTAAGFDEVHVVEHTIDAEVPPDTEVPESTWIGSIDEEYRDAVLADWREHRYNLVLDG
ncbi:MAG: hypothetical protein O7E57_04215 [Gammaproteobacteria bacterium]|nr:hypothetical protein [Gammaproteobacteria bacterium]